MTTNFKQKRIRDDKHLKFLRGLPCVVTGQSGNFIQAAHIRCHTDGGTSLKPSDCFAVPLCASEHFRQHSHGERTFWQDRLDDAISLALELYENSGDQLKCHRLIHTFLGQKKA